MEGGSTLNDEMQKGKLTMTGPTDALESFHSKWLRICDLPNTVNAELPQRSVRLPSLDKIQPLKAGWLLKKRDIFSGWRCRYFVVYPDRYKLACFCCLMLGGVLLLEVYCSDERLNFKVFCEFLPFELTRSLLRFTTTPLPHHNRTLLTHIFIRTRTSQYYTTPFIAYMQAGVLHRPVRRHTQGHHVADRRGGAAGEEYHLTAAQSASLIGGSDSTQHYHLADRDRANHTGTQSAATITGLGTASSQSGLSVTITTSKLTTSGSNGSMTFTNGVLTAQTPAT